MTPAPGPSSVQSSDQQETMMPRYSTGVYQPQGVVRDAEFLAPNLRVGDSPVDVRRFADRVQG